MEDVEKELSEEFSTPEKRMRWVYTLLLFVLLVLFGVARWWTLLIGWAGCILLAMRCCGIEKELRKYDDPHIAFYREELGTLGVVLWLTLSLGSILTVIVMWRRWSP